MLDIKILNSSCVFLTRCFCKFLITKIVFPNYTAVSLICNGKLKTCEIIFCNRTFYGLGQDKLTDIICITRIIIDQIYNRCGIQSNLYVFGCRSIKLITSSGSRIGIFTYSIITDTDTNKAYCLTIFYRYTLLISAACKITLIIKIVILFLCLIVNIVCKLFTGLRCIVTFNCFL